MNSDFRDKLSNAATVVEITLGMVILIACIVSGIGMVAMTDMNRLFGDPAYLQARMSSACLIIIGIELIKMITSYTIDSVVDVMLLAIARQMIVEHTSPIEIEEDVRAEVLGVENRSEPKKPEPPEIGSLI